LETVEVFAVLGGSFAARGVTHARPGHQIAFVTGVDEYFSINRLPALEPKTGDAFSFLHNAILQIQACVDDGDIIGRDELIEDPFRHLRLENVHQLMDVILAHRGLRVDSRGHNAVAPRRGIAVMQPDPVEELSAQPADERDLAHIGPA
jgi:hypothetical protein